MPMFFPDAIILPMNDTELPLGPPAHPGIRSFVRRAGRTSNAQARYFAEMMPKIGIEASGKLIDFSAAFGRKAPVVLEIGCGMGETTAAIAAASPQNNYLGIEVHPPGLGNLCKLAALQDLQNLRLIAHDAVDVVQRMIPEESLAGIHIFFPDPWPKKRHHKRRLIQAPFAAELARRLAPGGYLHCATDWEEYAGQMLAVLLAEPALQNTAEGYAPRPASRPITKFERRGQRLGHGVWDLLFTKKTSDA
jgi:tRNA (guanine-N7-)-methyltransferase